MDHGIKIKIFRFHFIWMVPLTHSVDYNVAPTSLLTLTRVLVEY